MQGPIFPMEASKKGATASEFGPVLGSVFFGQIFSPFIGKLTAKIGVGTSLAIGWIVDTIICTSFALISYIDDKNVYISLAYLLRKGFKNRNNPKKIKRVLNIKKRGYRCSKIFVIFKPFLKNN